ncbi:SDR family NAD(P)-dependent oxidoreductase [Mesorhizobium sp. KR9-304]|uniref:SDR family NAD(P)-dependent oxidoreductase n=1 Tax=Mesorhizobium sp. KR9-304 TaxID=3156614 RepID=UPI0032B3C2D3
MDLGLKDKRVVITGSSRGIGYAIAKAFLDEGARVLLNGVDTARLAQAEKNLQTPDMRIASFYTNIASVEGTRRLFAEVDRLWGRLDVCVNNAAIHEASDFTVLDEDRWDDTVNMNLKSVYLCAQAAFERMSRQDAGGVILNAASFASVIPAYPLWILQRDQSRGRQHDAQHGGRICAVEHPRQRLCAGFHRHRHECRNHRQERRAGNVADRAQPPRNGRGGGGAGRIPGVGQGRLHQRRRTRDQRRQVFRPASERQLGPGRAPRRREEFTTDLN